MAAPCRPPPAPPAHPAHPAPPAERVLTLEHGDHHDSTLYRFHKGSYLRFRPGPSLLGRKVFLYTNYVVPDNDGEGDEQAEFVRNQYYGLEWRRDGEEPGAAGARGDEPREDEPLGAGPLVTDTDVSCRLRLTRAGAFHYYFVYDAAEAAGGPAGSGWFQVAPALATGVPLAGVACHTVLTKCLGPLPRWERALRVSHESGYNMVHFTPVQRLGGSRSAYSIADQLRLDPMYAPDPARPATFADLEAVVAKMRTDWKMLSICDVVLNHTANETEWLGRHPEATYNCATCPYLRPAALLDALLARVSDEVARGELEPLGVPRRITAHEHVDAVRALLLDRVLPAARLHELYSCDVPDLVRRFTAAARERVPAPAAADGELRLVPDPQRRRLRASVDLELALRLYNVRREGCADEEARLAAGGAELRRALERLNAAAAELTAAHLRAAADNVAAGLRYERLQADGPREPDVARRPLATRYFTWPAGLPPAGLPPAGLPLGDAAALEAVLWGAEGALVMAHNGWVMDGDPLQDFAAPDQDGRVYLRRELIAWGDSVKLRYGARPEDSPFLWAHMREYVELTAEVFDGVRLDNCHSTPLHVAEYMVDCARNVKPNLYVAAELFTNSDHVDNIFVNRLGITALIREAMSAGEARELGRLVHRFGGRAVGSFLRDASRAARPRVARALLLDVTHDNPSPLRTRSVFHVLAAGALCAAAACATGSTRGVDELVPHAVHVVTEERLYPEWGLVAPDTGLVAARRALNLLHLYLAEHGYDEVYVDQMDDEVVAVTRHDPVTRQSVIVVAYTAFRPPDESAPLRTPPPLRFEGRLDEILLEASVRHRPPAPPLRGPPPPGGPPAHDALITGLDQYRCELRRAVPLADSGVFASSRQEGTLTELAFRPLLPGTVLAVRVAPHAQHAAALAELRATLGALEAAPPERALALEPALADLDLVDLNAALYRCDAEERAAGGPGAYDVPGRGPLPYAGLQGVASALAEATPADDLGHPLCANLRAGDWLLEYTWRRLEREPRLAALGARVRELLAPVTRLPRYLVPAHFAALAGALHGALTRAAAARMRVAPRGPFARALALTSVQLVGAVPPPLPPASPALPPAPRGSLAAGLPHFATGHMRCWGRDTFVALPGLLVLTGRHAEARHHILGFAACLRHGLIPNLLDGGARARYNCRDAVWWWLQAVQRYCEHVPGGHALLADPVSRMFPKDDAEPAPPGAHDQPLHDVIQEALDVHFQGLTFRERGAGRDIDAHMSERGFTVQIGVDPDTGFPFGGNEHNCGTWMDKMGSSERAGTRGRPATPRDGSAVELVGLCYSCVRWLAGQHAAGRHPYPGVVRRHGDGALTAWTWEQWARRIADNFERHFYVPPAPAAADARPDLVHRRAIYKDSHGASHPWADYRLRCNFPIAMAVAPELFDAQRAWRALDLLEELLLGPLGVKTLDPADWSYRPDYDGADDSDDPSVAHGFNYHQGPEWVWPLGFYLRARIAFAHHVGRHARGLAAAYGALAPALRELLTSPWRGLPELTNAGGAFCAGSCRTQAWSSALALEALHALQLAQRARPLGD